MRSALHTRCTNKHINLSNDKYRTTPDEILIPCFVSRGLWQIINAVFYFISCSSLIKKNIETSVHFKLFSRGNGPISCRFFLQSTNYEPSFEDIGIYPCWLVKFNSSIKSPLKFFPPAKKAMIYIKLDQFYGHPAINNFIPIYTASLPLHQDSRPWVV